jgi:hypothetical protein
MTQTNQQPQLCVVDARLVELFELHGKFPAIAAGVLRAVMCFRKQE